MARGLGLLGFVLLGAFASADLDRVHYTMNFDLENRTGEVEMKLPEGKTATKFWMSAWVPGDYQRFDYGSTITEISFFHEGEEVKLTGRDGINGFIGDDKWDSVKYRVKMSKGNFSDNLLVQSNLIFVSPAGVLGFADGMLQAPVELETTGPAGWDFQSALKDLGNDGKHRMEAKNHETLGDSPFLFAPQILRSKFSVGGKAHTFVGVGNTTGVDIEGFGAVAKKAVEQGLAEFGELPYDQYTFFGLWASFPAGLEHGTSCRLGMWGRNPTDMAGLIFHEYVHTFNVKHIRPESLRPIDPLNPPKISSLWWLEGVTDYFADLWMLRAGLIDEAGFAESMKDTYSAISRNPAYSKVSAQEASERVWEARGSQGFGGASYYTKGKLIGFYMDVLIRSSTDGKKNLGDLINNLYRETKDEKGYAESRISELLTELTGYPEPIASGHGGLREIVATANDVRWTSLLKSAGLVQRETKVVRDEDMDERAKAVYDSFFGKK